MIKIVVPISAGKDSQACLQLALESYPGHEVLGLFCDTGWEHPLSYQHIDTMRQMYGVEIRRLQASTVEDEIKKAGRFPAPLIRFCTDRLKIKPSRRFYADLRIEQGCGFEVWYGMRSGESTDRAKRYTGKLSDEVYAPHEINASYPKILAKSGVMFRLPILDWSRQDVVDYVGINNLNPLYKHGFDRVGCFPCLASTGRNQANAYNFDLFGAGQKSRVIALEAAIGKKHESANTAQVCMFCHI